MMPRRLAARRLVLGLLLVALILLGAASSAQARATARAQRWYWSEWRAEKVLETAECMSGEGTNAWWDFCFGFHDRYGTKNVEVASCLGQGTPLLRHGNAYYATMRCRLTMSTDSGTWGRIRVWLYIDGPQPDDRKVACGDCQLEREP
jgi:hypothetical protein